MNEAIKKDFENVRQLLDEVYYATCKNQPAWFVNKLTTIQLLIDELIAGE